MKSLLKGYLVMAAISLLVASCNNGASESKSEDRSDSLSKSESKNMNIKEEAVSYEAGGTTLKGYVTYDENSKATRPVVLVVPEWWGLTEYPRMRAKQLAEMGYLAMAVDMYGDGKTAGNPEEAQKLATPFYTNGAMAKARLDAALAKARSLAQADTSKVAAIGYCFGGSMVLNAAKMGSPFLGVVSFHGDLAGVPPTKGMTTKFLICHGEADSFVPPATVAAFKKSMDSVGADYTFKSYPNATHAFTNPDATKKGEEFKMPIRYNGAADTASWNDMKAFFARIF